MFLSGMCNVKNVALSKNSDTICLSCKEYLFFANHDACVAQYLKNMQKRKVVKCAKQKVTSEWKPTRRIFKTVGLKWVPTGRMFTLIVEIVLWYSDSGCSSHMTRHRDKLINFVSKFIRMVRFGNDHFASIMRYGDLQMGNNLEGVDLLSGSRGFNLYTISVTDMMKSSPILSTLQSFKDKILVMASSPISLKLCAALHYNNDVSCKRRISTLVEAAEDNVIISNISTISMG
ncbi:hypothetical protein Tco_1056350 [Tanacetum coccineum]|uniref:Retrovirus-related Pol polyprotein from transposon TNT 1-94-like beta-barrel domain-containing protein n=1 Tax=Tanacetum coccineum TaxID=301880 RepID=A0ABQ5H279_9ASTR